MPGLRPGQVPAAAAQLRRVRRGAAPGHRHRRHGRPARGVGAFLRGRGVGGRRALAAPARRRRPRGPRRRPPRPGEAHPGRGRRARGRRGAAGLPAAGRPAAVPEDPHALLRREDVLQVQGRRVAPQGHLRGPAAEVCRGRPGRAVLPELRDPDAADGGLRGDGLRVRAHMALAADRGGAAGARALLCTPAAGMLGRALGAGLAVPRVFGRAPRGLDRCAAERQLDRRALCGILQR
mmetsp:Transcript_118467/g.330477  ORF Transcript_118467/g.330477 Transcript_118467/m.330477 type:complete len:236 (+) Transcript_118467:340-1047(+)